MQVGFRSFIEGLAQFIGVGFSGFQTSDERTWSYFVHVKTGGSIGSENRSFQFSLGNALSHAWHGSGYW